MNAPVNAPVAASSKPSFWRAVKTVAWSFIGIRRKSGFQEDLSKVNPFHIILVGIVGALLFVGTLVAIVNWVVAK